MDRKFLWLMVSGLMALSLVIAACGPAATISTAPSTSTATTNTNVSTTTTPTTVPVSTTTSTIPGTSAEMPRYGGTITIAMTTDVTNWDDGFTMNPATWPLTNEELCTGDWTLGPAGTGECDWMIGGTNRMDQETGALAESWEFPTVGHLIFHIRHGIHYGLNPDSAPSKLVNGRELTADDIVYSINRVFTAPKSYVHSAYPDLSSQTKVTAPDKWTVDIVTPAAQYSNAVGVITDLMQTDIPQEVIQKYGDMNNARVQVGTGPYMTTSYVPGSIITLVKNPNFWMKDPIGPGKGNQLPYIDDIRILIIPDTSTSQAALRTGKLDKNSAATLDDLAVSTRGAPQLLSKKMMAHTGSFLAMWLYKPNLPFHDLKVRQAMMMATDFNIIKDQLYKGDAQIQTWPNPFQKEYASIFVPISQMPKDVQDLYTYNPDKAKALLKEAGYPSGFKTKILCNNQSTTIDYLSIIKDQWGKVGIDLTFDSRETTIWQTMVSALNYEEMVYSASGGSIGRYYSGNTIAGPPYFNTSQINDPKINDYVAKFSDYFNANQMDKLDAAYCEMLPYLLSQAYVIPKPQAYQYTLWWPWLKNHHGENSIGNTNTYNYIQYAWIDQDLKKSMGY